jgi:hypothetical protein
VLIRKLSRGAHRTQSSEDGRAEHEVHDNVEDEDRGVDAPCPHGATTQDGTDIPLMKDKLAGAMVL